MTTDARLMEKPLKAMTEEEFSAFFRAELGEPEAAAIHAALLLLHRHMSNRASGASAKVRRHMTRGGTVEPLSMGAVGALADRFLD